MSLRAHTIVHRLLAEVYDRVPEAWESLEHKAQVELQTALQHIVDSELAGENASTEPSLP